jgi:hypothetical protein
MAQNGTGGKWSRKKARAALLVAEDRLTNERIAAAVGVSRRQLDRWKTEAAFLARVQEHIAAQENAVLQTGIARKLHRVGTLNEVVQDLLRLKDERAAASSRQGVPGGESGLLVRTVKMVGSGPTAQLVEEWRIDDAFLRELREYNEQAARELGQWREAEAEPAPPAVSLAQVVIASREDAKAYLTRMQNGQIPGVQRTETTRFSPTLSAALDAAGEAVPPADAEPRYDGPDGL